jgi:MFS family permease
MEPTAKRLDEVLDSIPQGLFQFRLLVMCGLALMADAMEVSLLSFISDCAGAEWDLSSSQKATVVSVVFAGQLVGSFCWGSFADYYGRRLAFIMVSIVVSVGGFVSAFAPSYMWLVIFRAVVGFGVGGLIVPYDLLAELSPCSHRGQSLLFTEYFWSFGSLSVAGVAWAVLSTYGWRALTLATAVPVSISSLICLLYLPESPRWLLAEGKIPEAEQVLRDAARVNGVELPPFTLIEETNTMHGEQSEKDGSDCVRITELFDTPKMRKVSMPLATVWFLFGFTYYGLIVFISRIYVVKPEDGGQVCTFAYADIFLNASAEIVGVFSAMMLIDRWGRRLSQMSFYIVASVGVVVLGVMASTGLSSILRIVSGMMARCFVKAALVGPHFTNFAIAT